ncbi:MAG TPA: hypothetical protein PLU53_04200 [Bacteroidia bacterium]|nr:hypothetical protein [Bacteroidia bacterium]
MKENTDNIELIEAYVEGRLSPDEILRVKQLLQNDPEFREEYDLYCAIVKGIKINRDKFIIRDKLQQLDKELDSGKSSGIFPMTKQYLFANRYAIAAGLVLVLLASSLTAYYAYFSPRAVFTENYIQDPGLPVLMGSDENLKVGQAMNFYKTGDLQSSFRLLNQLYVENPGNDTLQYYNGVLLLSLDKPADAIRYFQACLSNASSNFHADAEYRLATAYFLDGQKALAKNIFTAIAGSNANPYRDSAVQFLKNL